MSLGEEVAVATNTKREIKTLIAQLSSTVKGLILCGRHTGKVNVSTSSRGNQADLGPSGLLPTTNEHPDTKTAGALLGSHIGKLATAVPAPENKIPSPTVPVLSSLLLSRYSV